MRAFKVFIFGLLYGWFVKIAFDRIYRENEIEDILNENESLKEYIRTLEIRREPASLESKSVLRTEPLPEESPAPKPTTSEKDNLKIIRGVGPVIEKKLNNAGIHTFAALAALSAEQLESILGSQVKRLQDENDLIAQAKKLAKGR